jgi:hypothetical protein
VVDLLVIGSLVIEVSASSEIDNPHTALESSSFEEAGEGVLHWCRLHRLRRKEPAMSDTQKSSPKTAAKGEAPQSTEEEKAAMKERARS